MTLIFVGMALFGLGVLCASVGQRGSWTRKLSDMTPDWAWLGRLLIVASIVVPVLLYALQMAIGTE